MSSPSPLRERYTRHPGNGCNRSLPSSPDQLLLHLQLDAFNGQPPLLLNQLSLPGSDVLLLQGELLSLALHNPSLLLPVFPVAGVMKVFLLEELPGNSQLGKPELFSHLLLGEDDNYLEKLPDYPLENQRSDAAPGQGFRYLLNEFADIFAGDRGTAIVEVGDVRHDRELVVVVGVGHFA